MTQSPIRSPFPAARRLVARARGALESLRTFCLLLVGLLFADLARATWSIIIVDTRTGEIAIASATCLTGFDLQFNASVVVVGRGAAAAQSFVDTTGQNRVLIFNQLLAGTDPAQILQLLAAQDGAHQTRQYGIVDTQGRAIGFTGTGAGGFASHLTGSVGTLVYAIQGNVLTGQPVLSLAEQAILNTPGDLADKIMAAMEAARSMGGDGRCSCLTGSPVACGSPPPSFTKSAHIGYVVVARPGDTDGVCTLGTGCANGHYHLNINIAGQTATAPDPIYQLQSQFLNWRLQHLLRPDHFRSEVTVEPASLLDDGATTATLRIVLRDWRGERVPFGGAQVQVQNEPGSAVTLPVGAPVDHGDGSYSVPIGPSSQAGIARLRVTVDDGVGAVRLGPPTEVAVTGDSLWLSRGSLDTATGGTFDAVLRAGGTAAGRTYLVVGSASGTSPGLQLGGITVPVQPDFLTFALLDAAANSSLPGLIGRLDAQGRGSVPFAVPPAVLSFLRGGSLHFAYALALPFDFASNPVPLNLR